MTLNKKKKKKKPYYIRKARVMRLVYNIAKWVYLQERVCCYIEIPKSKWILRNYYILRIFSNISFPWSKQHENVYADSEFYVVICIS